MTPARRRQPDAPPQCELCRQTIARGEPTLPLSRGVAHRRCNDERVAAALADAVANGSHSEAWAGLVCPQCGQWVRGLWSGPMDGRTGACLDCSAKRGDESARRELAKARAA